MRNTRKKVKETSDVLNGCREVLHDGSNEIVAQMLTFINRVDGRLKQIKTQVNKIDEAKSSHLDITRKVSSLEITVKELKEKNKDMENSTQVMSDLFEDAKNNCSSNKTEIDTLKRRFEEVAERTSIRREELREHRQEQKNIKTDITDLKCRSMKNNLIFTGLFE
jgi:chromosome segregation ATPase